MRKQYLNQRTDEATDRASVALTWHNAGDAVGILDPNKGNYSIVAGAQIEKPDFESECRDHCKRIAEDADAYAQGSVYECPECGEVFTMPDDVGDKYKCHHCGEVNDVDDYEQKTMYDYMSDVLDLEYRVTRDKEYRSCEICVGCGGPNIYIDTADAYVKLYWGSTQTQYPIKYETRDALDEVAEEFYLL